MFKNIETERCRLRPFRETDLRTFAAYRSNVEVARYQSWSSYSYEDALAHYAELSSKPFGLEGEWYQIALADRATDVLVGDVAVHFVGPGVAEVGFTIAPEFQGRGYGKEGLRGALGYLFDDLGHERVLATTDARNAPSIGALESVGFDRAPGAARTVTFKGELGEEFDYVYPRDKWVLRTRG